MKVLYLIHDTTISGASISLFNLLRGLREKGVVIFIAGPKLNEKYGELVKSVDAKYYEVEPALSVMPPLKSIRNVLAFPKNYIKLIKKKRRYQKQLYRIIDEVTPALIHTNVGVLHEGLRVAEIKRIPHVMHIREYQDLDFNWRFYPSKRKFEQMVERTNTICISKDIQQHIHLGQNPHSRVIYNGILSEKDATYNSSKKNYFMTASRISPEKSVDLTIRAFSKFITEHQDYTLRVFGDGADVYKQALKDLCKSLSITDKVSFEGYKPDIPYYLAEAKALVVSSKNEGFGRMSAEALIKGCALIGKNTGGTKEIMGEVDSFPFDDENECVLQMCHIANMDEAEYERKALVSQSKAIELFSIEKNIESVYSFYTEILNNYKS